MQKIVYVDEYQPSSACVTIGKDDPFYKISSEAENIRVGKLAVPPATVGVLLILALAGCLVLVTQKS